MKILIICSNLVGDTILSSGVITHFKEIFPNASYNFVIGPTAKPLLKNVSNIESLISINKKKYNLHWLIIYLKTFRTKWDIVVDLRSSLLHLFLKNKNSMDVNNANNTAFKLANQVAESEKNNNLFWSKLKLLEN